MGQSMEKPNSPRLRQDKLALRSLQRTSRSSVNLEPHFNHSAQKMQPHQRAQLLRSAPFTGAQAQRIDMPPQSADDNYPYNIKPYKSLGNLKLEIIGDESVYSPIFKQIAEEEGEYGLKEWKEQVEAKPIQKSSSESHHEMTISFSKTKNQNSHHIHEETLIPRENLFKILEDQQNSQNEERSSLIRFSAADPKQLNSKNLSNEQSNACNQQSRPTQVLTDSNQELPQGKQKTNEQNSSSENSVRDCRNNNQSSPTKDGFNDYDYTDFKGRNREGEHKSRKKLKLSKKLLEVKEKLISVAHTPDHRNDFLKSLSVQNLSQSFRNLRGCDSIRQNCAERRNKDKQGEAANQEVKNQSIKYRNSCFLETDKKMAESRSTGIELSKKSLPNSPNQKSKDAKTDEKSSTLLVFSGNEAFLCSNEVLSDRNRKRGSITQKQPNASSENLLLMSNRLRRNFEQKQQKTQASIQSQEYDLIGIVSPRKWKAFDNTNEQKSSKEHQQTDVRAAINKKPENLASPQSSSHIKQSIHHALAKSKDLKKSSNPNSLQNSEKKGRANQQRRDPEKRYRSSQSKNLLNSKLLVF